MAERNSFALLLHDDFMGEFVDSDRKGETFRTLENAHWGASVLLEELQKDELDLKNDDASSPYQIYIVGPDGNFTRYWD